MGHIALPVPVYNPIFFDQMYRLLRSMCLYCFHLRMAKTEVNCYTCKLVLLEHGLVTEIHGVDVIRLGKIRLRTKEEGENVESEDEADDADSLIDKRNAYVKEAITKSKESMRGQRTTEHITIVEHERRVLIKDFLKAIGGSGRCSNCNG